MLAAAVAAAASGLAAEICATVGRVACAPAVDGCRDACYAESFPIAGFSRIARGISLGDRTLISVSEYRELKPITVKVNYTPKAKVRATDVETGETLGVFGPSDRVLPVTLGTDRRCRLILLEPVR